MAGAWVPAVTPYNPTTGIKILNDDLAGIIFPGDTTSLGKWQTWVPTWSASGTAPAIGNSTVNARYVQIGKTVIAKFDVTFGNTAVTFGTGFYTFSLPVTAANGAGVPGTSRLFDNSSGFQGHGLSFLASTTTFDVQYIVANTTSAAIQAGQLVPWTWAVSDIISVEIEYEAA